MRKNKTVMLQSTERHELIASQIIYVESCYDKLSNHFIKNNLEKITDEFKKKGFDFIYFPKINDDFINAHGDLWELVNYCYPYITDKSGFEKQMSVKSSTVRLNLSTLDKTRQLFSALDYGNVVNPGLFRLVNDSEPDNFTFEYFQFDLSRTEYFWEQIEKYAESLVIEILPCSSADAVADSNEQDIPADFEIIKCSKPAHRAKRKSFSLKDKIFKGLFDADADREETSINMEAGAQSELLWSYASYSAKEYNVIEKIKNSIREAKRLGIYEEVIREALATLAEDAGARTNWSMKISRLVIDSEYSIYLPDYGSMEIKMSTLPKALFILFLRHPEGIILKQLSDYESELMKIYQTISNRENQTGMHDSVKRICSPADSSLNEKLSRIRESFAKKMTDSYAVYYYVTGDRGEKKQIKLDRELVSLPKELS